MFDQTLDFINGDTGMGMKASGSKPASSSFPSHTLSKSMGPLVSRAGGIRVTYRISLFLQGKVTALSTMKHNVGENHDIKSNHYDNH